MTFNSFIVLFVHLVYISIVWTFSNYFLQKRCYCDLLYFYDWKICPTNICEHFCGKISINVYEKHFPIIFYKSALTIFHISPEFHLLKWNLTTIFHMKSSIKRDQQNQFEIYIWYWFSWWFTIDWIFILSFFIHENFFITTSAANKFKFLYWSYKLHLI